MYTVFSMDILKPFLMIVSLNSSLTTMMVSNGSRKHLWETLRNYGLKDITKGCGSSSVPSILASVRNSKALAEPEK